MPEPEAKSAEFVLGLAGPIWRGKCLATGLAGCRLLALRVEREAGVLRQRDRDVCGEIDRIRCIQADHGFAVIVDCVVCHQTHANGFGNGPVGARAHRAALACGHVVLAHQGILGREPVGDAIGRGIAVAVPDIDGQAETVQRLHAGASPQRGLGSVDHLDVAAIALVPIEASAELPGAWAAVVGIEFEAVLRQVERCVADRPGAEKQVSRHHGIALDGGLVVAHIPGIDRIHAQLVHRRVSRLDVAVVGVHSPV